MPSNASKVKVKWVAQYSSCARLLQPFLHFLAIICAITT